MIQDRQANPTGQAQLKTVFYARRSPSEPPIMVTMDLKPYVPSPNENIEYVQFLQPANPVGAGQQPPALFEQTMPLGFSQPQSFASQTYYDGQMQYGPRTWINGFSPCSKVVSVFLILNNLAMVVAGITFTFLALFVGNANDQYTNAGILGRSLALCFSFAVILLRTVLVPCLGWEDQLKCQEKVALSLNFIMPAYKYHIIRLNPNFQGKFTKLYRRDIIIAVYQLFVALFAFFTFTESYNYNTGDSDPIWILFGLFAFLDFCGWILVMILHLKWAKELMLAEKRRAALSLLLPMTNPLLQQQPQQTYINTNGLPAYGQPIIRQPNNSPYY